MITYTPTRREKVLLAILVFVLVFLAWFILVFQGTSAQIGRLQNEIATVQGDIALAGAQVSEMRAMEEAIEQGKAEGVDPRPVPAYDNMTPLMTELNRILGSTSNYTLSFDELDAEAAGDYVLRGVRADYSCNTVAEAEAVAGALENGAYPCAIDSITIADHAAGGTSRAVGVAGGAPVSASVHVTFVERAGARS